MATDFEYWLVDAMAQFPGSLDHSDVVDFMHSMNSHEITNLKLALASQDSRWVGEVIVESIQRQADEKICEIASVNHHAHMEALREDAESIML